MARHPFDARRSGRDPFPDFEATMRQLGSDDESNAQFSHTGSSRSSGSDWASRGSSRERDSHSDGDDDEGGCTCGDGGCDSACGQAAPVTLRWSIDALATLLPRTFSPLSHQKRPLDSHWTPDQIQTQTHRHRRRRRWSGGSGSASDHQHKWTPPSTGGRTPGFFEDEAQYDVLRTPAALVEREQMLMHMHQQSGGGGGGGAAVCAEYTRWRAPEATRWRDLHRRCVDTIQLCEERLRERQHKLRRLPIAASKLKPRRRSTASGLSSNRTSETKTPLQSAAIAATTTPGATAGRDPLTPVVATRLSFGSIDLSPIPVDTTEKRRTQTIAMHEDTRSSGHDAFLPATPPATRKPPVLGSGTSFLSPTPSLSSIAEHPNDVLTPSFASLRFAASDHEDREAKANKESDQPCSGGSSSGDVSASSLRTMSLLRAEGGDASWSSSSSPFTPPSSDRTISARNEQLLAEEETKENEAIAKRQLSFMAAIEEEAQARDAHKSRRDARSETATEESESEVATDDGAGHPRATSQPVLAAPPQPRQQLERRLAAPPATSMASIYKEARALGITEPTAQWEYVQLIAKQTSSQRRPI